MFMINTIKNITTSLIAVQPHNSSRVEIYHINNNSLDIIIGINIIISLLGIIILG